MWAGEFPHDMDHRQFVNYTDTIPQKWFCVGDEDQFITQNKIEELKGFLLSYKFEIEIKAFEGKHEIDRNILAELF